MALRKKSTRRRHTKSLRQAETLEARVVLDARLLITEFVADNDESLLDEFGDDPDWIEIFNAGEDAVNVEGWHLTDDSNDLGKSELGSRNIEPGQYLVVFASGKDLDDPLLGNLHTNFQLDSNGEYLALTRPDESIAFEYAPSFPLQVEDVAYGIPSAVTRTTLTGTGATAKLLIPTSGDDDPNLANEEFEGSWIDPDFDDSGWTDAVTGVGYWDESNDPNPKPGDGTVIADSVAEFSGSQGADDWRYGYWNATNDDDYDPDTSDFTLFINVPAVGFINTWDVDSMKWDLKVRTNNPHNTELRSDGALPAGSDSDTQVHHPIRRWTSEITGGVMFHGTIDNPDPSGDGVIARILIDGEEVFSREVNGNSGEYKVIRQVTTGQKIDFMLDPGELDNAAGDDTLWDITIEDVTPIVGELDGVPTLTEDIATDIENDMKGVGSSAYIRILFTPETTDFDSLSLRVKYQDGFIAYLNGQEIARSSSAGIEHGAWNSTASSERTVVEAKAFESFNVTGALDLLSPGVPSVLMVQALNVSAADDDLLLVPELLGTKQVIDETDFLYFLTTTPGEQNGLGTEEVGPLFRDSTHSPNVPQSSAPIVVTTDVAETFDAIANVTLNYRVMYGATSQIPMVDDGTGADAVAGDGIYTATIPDNIGQSGEMVRWFMTGTDSSGNESRFPTFVVSNDSEEYFGTVYLDSSIDSNLPVIHTFFESPNSANNDTGTYGSFFYNGEFYDNVNMNLHGQSSRSFPKRSYDVFFPEDHRFTLNDDVPAVTKFNLLSNYADKAKLRNSVAWETRRLTGAEHHLAFPVRIEQNGSFFAVYDYVEDADARWLERMGLDPSNQLWKSYNTFNTAAGAEKKTAKDTGNEDMAAFIDGLNQTGDARTDFIYDNVNLAAMANYLAGFVLTADTDCCHKNYYVYRDDSGSGEWWYFDWDVDLTYGRNWGGFGLSYHDYTIYNRQGLRLGTNNHFVSKLYQIPEFAEMYNRRVRTIMDDVFGQPDEGNTTIEDYVQYLVDQIGEDGPVDHAKWGQVSSNSPQQPFETWPEAVDKLLNQYLIPRREYLFETLSVVDPDPGEEEDPVLVFEGADVPMQYFVPGDNSLILDGNNDPILTWAQTDFDDGAWESGQLGIGYDYAGETATVVDPDDVIPGASTIMTRTTFDLADPAAVEKMTLNVKHDDGFIAYINGTEVARFGVAGTVQWNSLASNHADSAAVVFQPFVFDVVEDGVTLQETGNVLAVQVVNQSVTSSDMLLNYDLYTGVVSNAGGNTAIPGRQDADALIEIVSLDHNPVSGNQDEEYIQLTNNNDFAVDITNWELVGGVRMTFQPGTVISAGGSLYVTPDAKAFRARATGPSGGQQLFVQGGYRGHLSNFGETIDLLRRDATTSATFTYPGDPSPTQEFLRITEIMYNPMRPSAAELQDIPDVDNDDFEYAELTNISSTETLDLTGVRFTSGFQFDFTDSDVTSLAPGDHVLVVKDLAAFNARYGNGLDALIAGEFSDGSLNNGGEAIKLEDATNSTVLEFSYNDDTDGGWTERADGRGSSLQIVDTTGEYGDGSNWRPSAEISGSPGSAGGAPLSGLVINEVLTNTEPPSLDAIELHNSSGAAIQLGNYYLSDSAASLEALQSYSLPATTIAAGEYVVFDETQFNSSGGVDPNDFALSSLGDQVYLTVGDGNQATHFVDFVNFGAVAAGESFGRFPNATGALVPMVETTLNDVNSGPRVGPVIISEVNYNAGEPTASDLAIAPNMDEGDLEFVEIHNTTNDQILLTDWRMRGGVDIEFDEGSTLDAGETIVVVSFNPQNPVNADRVSAFRFHYGIEGTVRLVGGYSGQLDNGGERVTLQRPDAPVGDPIAIIPR
jgi:hypothetical protein